MESPDLQAAWSCNWRLPSERSAALRPRSADRYRTGPGTAALRDRAFCCACLYAIEALRSTFMSVTEMGGCSSIISTYARNGRIQIHGHDSAT